MLTILFVLFVVFGALSVALEKPKDPKKPKIKYGHGGNTAYVEHTPESLAEQRKEHQEIFDAFKEMARKKRENALKDKLV